MTRLTLTSGLSAASVPPLPPDAAQIGCGDWSVDGLLVGCAFIQSYIDYVFEGEFSSTSVEWVDLKQLTNQLAIPTSTEYGGDSSEKPLGTLKPIQLEEECSPLGRKSFLFAVESEQKTNAELCASLLARGHTHALATVVRYERRRPPLPDHVDEEELKDVSLRWSWTTKMRQSIQRICRQMDDDEDHYVVCSESMASKSGASSLPATNDEKEDFCPMISVRRVSMIDVEDVKVEARVWLESVAVDAKKADNDEDPFGNRESASFAVSVDAKDIRQKEIKGKIDEIAHQVFVVLSCFT